MKRSTREAWQGILYILPGFLLIFTFSIVPIFMTGYFSLTDYNLMRPAQLIG
ncbi:MAG: sugar ABC transporter permease, partial [Lachnospiraceae bacterium]|nr:sugar ABC transporter permease [Lachnospiraceae bacterium]